MAPGTDMAFRMVDRDERMAVIAYLKSLVNEGAK
jgi:cytochrome c2